MFAIETDWFALDLGSGLYEDDNGRTGQEMKATVTGAAGFIGSHLVDALLSSGWYVLGIDNLATGHRENVEKNEQNPHFLFERLDLRRHLPTSLFERVDAVFHFAADPEVRTGSTNPGSQFENNVLATYNLLEAMRRAKVNRLYFASSSTVYGEPSTVPTDESAPLRPISMYGASKLACEVMVSAYCQTFGIKTTILRPANIVGGRATHGVLVDFIAKLRATPESLEILGDGKQNKSYVHVKDFVQAVTLISNSKMDDPYFDVFNVGNVDRTSVTCIADIVGEEMGLSPYFKFTGGDLGGRAWKGDVKSVLLSIEKISSLGWKPTLSSDDSIRLAVKEILSGNQ